MAPTVPKLPTAPLAPRLADFGDPFLANPNPTPPVHPPDITMGGPVYIPGYPPITTTTGPGGKTAAGGAGVGIGTIGTSATSFFSCLFSPTNCLKRLAIFILGIIAIIGAIYLYKDTRVLVTAPLNAARDAVRTAGEAAAA